MPTQAEIRRLTAADARDYRHIRLSALRTTPDAFGSTFEAEANRSDDQHASRLLSSVVFGAYAGNQIVGVLGCKRHEGAREAHKAFLWGFFVEPAYRRSGVASELLKASLHAVPAGVEQILLTVVADNRPAIGLYERFGFRPYGLEPRSLTSAGAPSGAYIDEMLMVLFLADRTSP